MSGTEKAREPNLATRRAARAVGAVVALALLVGAIGTVVARREEVRDALQSAQGGAGNLLRGAALLTLIAVNIAMSGAFFRLLLSRFGRIGLLEMQAVVAAATLVNYLPLRPGLFARVAYHRRVNGIAVAHALRVVFEATAISGLVTAYLVVSVAMAARAEWPAAVVVAAPLPVLAVLLVPPRTRVWAAAITIRYLEILVWAVRMVLVFAMLGVSLTPLAALACAGAVVVTALVPFVSNGLGLTEWSIGLLAPALVGVDVELGLAAQLLNRAAEMIVVVALGVPAFLWTSRRLAERE